MISKVVLSFVCAIIFLLPTQTEAQTEYKEGTKIVVMFSAEWCTYCQVLKGTIHRSSQTQILVKEKYNGNFWIIEEHQQQQDAKIRRWFRLAEPYIQGFPTTIVFRLDDKGFWTTHQILYGNQTEQQFLDFLNLGLLDRK